jgi:hypothetical protein
LTTETPTGIVIELTAGMQDGHDDLGGRAPLLGVRVDRDASPIIADGDRFVGVDGYRHGIAIPGERLVDRVVDDLENHVVQAGAVIGVADVHPGAFPNRLEAL